MKKIIMGANLILLTVVAGLCVDLFYGLLDHQCQAALAKNKAPSKSASNAAVEINRATTKSMLHYRPILKRDLFKTGGGPNKLEPTPEPTGHLEPTDLNIKLWGTVTGNGPVEYAVIEAKGQNGRPQQNLYREGDKVASATIETILDDKIVLNSNGVDQVLHLEKFKQNNRLRYNRRHSTRRRPRVQHRSISRRSIEKATQNISQLISQARVVPVQNGMRLSAVKPNSVFRRLGLRSGDVITSVDNRRISSMEEAMDIYQRLQTGDKISIDLLRRNRPWTIEYRVR